MTEFLSLTMDAAKVETETLGSTQIKLRGLGWIADMTIYLMWGQMLLKLKPKMLIRWWTLEIFLMIQLSKVSSIKIDRIRVEEGTAW
jgi:hypothetical protein